MTRDEILHVCAWTYGRFHSTRKNDPAQIMIVHQGFVGQIIKSVLFQRPCISWAQMNIPDNRRWHLNISSGEQNGSAERVHFFYVSLIHKIYAKWNHEKPDLFLAEFAPFYYDIPRRTRKTITDYQSTREQKVSYN